MNRPDPAIPMAIAAERLRQVTVAKKVKDAADPSRAPQSAIQEQRNAVHDNLHRQQRRMFTRTHQRQ